MSSVTEAYREITNSQKSGNFWCMCNAAVTLKRCLEKASLVADIEGSVGWTKLWDAALDFGVKHTRGLQALSRVIGHHGRGVKPCPVCDVLGPFACLLGHVLKDHTMGDNGTGK